MRVTTFGLESMSEPVGGADAEFESFMQTALASHRAPHSAPDVLEVYEATRLVTTEHSVVEISASEAEPLPDDRREKITDTEPMTDINREELDAKLSAVEARMDRRISDFGADMRQVVADFRVEMAPMKNIKTSIWSAAGFIVASMIAVIGLTVTGFYTGRDTSNLINEAKIQTQETRNLLEQIKAQQLGPLSEKEAPPSPQK